MTSIIVMHRADPDGIDSGALLLEDLLSKGERDVDLRFVDHSDWEGQFQVLLSESRKDIYLADLTPSGPKITDEMVLTLADQNRVTLYDHHPLRPGDRLALIKKNWGKVVVPPRAQYGGPAKQCSAMLIKKDLGLDGDRHKLLAYAAQCTDYPGRGMEDYERLGRQINRAIRPESGLDLADIVHILACSPLEDWVEDFQLKGRLRQAYLTVEELAGKAKEKMLDSVSTHTLRGETLGTPRDLRGLRLVCALAPGVLYMKEGLHTLRDEVAADVYMVFYEDLPNLVFSPSKQYGDEKVVPVLPFLRSKDGGGRQNSGGFCYQNPTTKETYAARRDALIDEFERFTP